MLEEHCMKEAEIATCSQQLKDHEKRISKSEEHIERVFNRLDRLMYTIWGATVTLFAGLIVEIIRLVEVFRS